MSLREALMAACARSQRGIRVRAGDRFVRGVEVVHVLAVADGNVQWEAPLTGEVYDLPAAMFRGRALRRLSAPSSAQGAPSLLDAVWGVLGSGGLTPEERLAIFDRAFTGWRARLEPEDVGRVEGWLAAVRRGEEPER